MQLYLEYLSFQNWQKVEEGVDRTVEEKVYLISSNLILHQNINVRAAFIHVIGDLIQSVGVLVAALVIFFFVSAPFSLHPPLPVPISVHPSFQPDWSVVDPICTLFFSIIVLFTTIYIMRDALVVLLEGLLHYPLHFISTVIQVVRQISIFHWFSNHWERFLACKKCMIYEFGRLQWIK